MLLGLFHVGVLLLFGERNAGSLKDTVTRRAHWAEPEKIKLRISHEKSLAGFFALPQIFQIFISNSVARDFRPQIFFMDRPNIDPGVAP